MVGRKDQLKITDLIRDPREMGPISDKGPEEREAQQYQDISHEDAGEEPESLETPVGAPVIDPENLEPAETGRRRLLQRRTYRRVTRRIRRGELYNWMC